MYLMSLWILEENPEKLSDAFLQKKQDRYCKLATAVIISARKRKGINKKKRDRRKKRNAFNSDEPQTSECNIACEQDR